MNSTLTRHDVQWQAELEERAEEAVANLRAKRFVNALPPAPEPTPGTQMVGLALCAALIGAFVTVALLAYFKLLQ